MLSTKEFVYKDHILANNASSKKIVTMKSQIIVQVQ